MFESQLINTIKCYRSHGGRWTQVGVLHVGAGRGRGEAEQLVGVLTLLGVASLQVVGHQWSQLPATHLRPLQPPCPYELLDLLRLHLGHE